MEERRKALTDELATVEVSQKTLKAFNILAYTAEETDGLPFKLCGDELETIVKLICLARHYQRGVPKKLRM